MFSERARRRLARKCYPYELEKEYVAIAAAYVALLYRAIKTYLPELKRAQARLDNISSPATRKLVRRKEARRIVNKARRMFKRMEKTFNLDAKIDVFVTKIEVFRIDSWEEMELAARKAMREKRRKRRKNRTKTRTERRRAA